MGFYKQLDLDLLPLLNYFTKKEIEYEIDDKKINIILCKLALSTNQIMYIERLVKNTNWKIKWK